MTNDDFKKAIEAIKLRAPIEDVVRERVPNLKKAGALWVACCPFHEERTPSFKVDPRRGTWRCYGACADGGDQIKFLQRFDNLDFRDALEILAARTGVEIPRTLRPQGPGDGDAGILAALEHATQFFRAQLATSEGQAAVRYLRGRGLAPATVDAFGVGYAPSSGQALVAAAREARIDFEVLEKAGLARRNDSGRPYDFFRGRLMIPIRDVKGRTLGFGGRVLDDSTPKYVNTPETEVFHKGRLVYALDRALPVVRREGRIVLVEGYTDVMAAHQCGVGCVVAVLGTATTEDHAGLLRKTGARRISLVFDGDEAGRKAAYKALHGLLHLEVEIDVVSLPGGDDPCDLLVREGAAAFTAQLDQAQGWFDFLLEGLRGVRGAELSREVDRVLELLARLAKPVHRDARIAELARAIEIPVASVRAQFDALPARLSALRQEARRSEETARSPRGDTARSPRGDTARSQRGDEARTANDEGVHPSSSSTSSSSAPVAPAPRPLDPMVVRAFEDMLGAVLRDVGTLLQARPWIARCPDTELAHVFAVLEQLYQDEDATIDEASVTAALGEDPARDRIEPIVSRVALVAEDLTPQAFLELQIQYLDRRDREARVRRERRQLAEREADLMRQSGVAEAAADPEIIEAARRIGALRGATSHPSNP